jgi:hypothetical protein
MVTQNIAPASQPSASISVRGFHRARQLASQRLANLASAEIGEAAVAPQPRFVSRAISALSDEDPCRRDEHAQRKHEAGAGA